MSTLTPERREAGSGAEPVREGGGIRGGDGVMSHHKATAAVLLDVMHERDRQNAKWGDQRHDWGDWIAILGEEFGEASKEVVELVFGPENDTSKLRTELIHLAAVAVQIIEHIDEVDPRSEATS